MRNGPTKIVLINAGKYEYAEVSLDGAIQIVGRNNAGKSTLLNRFVGQKVAIVSDKPQTTRNKIAAILNKPNLQVIFMDTPGIHTPKHKLGQFLNQEAEEALEDAGVLAGSGEQGFHGFIGDVVAQIVASGLLPGAIEIMDHLAIQAAQPTGPSGEIVFQSDQRRHGTVVVGARQRRDEIDVGHCSDC